MNNRNGEGNSLTASLAALCAGVEMSRSWLLSRVRVARFELDGYGSDGNGNVGQ